MDQRVAVRFDVVGTVQGVGFRPFVHRLATQLRLDGWVCNSGGHVAGAVAGPPEAVRAFRQLVRTDAPGQARVRKVHLSALGGSSPVPGSGFTVRTSTVAPVAMAGPREVPPDAATCGACLHELFDPADRRSRYPFIACSDCGPRATVIEALPYDRDRTTMRHFPLCPACSREYTDPLNRRFHAEPLACPACGPELSWEGLRGEAALRSAVTCVADGGIIAVKGLGGYELVCDATAEAAVAELRRRKNRPAKPLAVMAQDLRTVRRLARVSATERKLLASPVRPVVLLAAREHTPVAAAVYPGVRRIGVLLPTTGLHHLLLGELAGPLVVTSGNQAGGPIVTDDAEARHALGPVVDGFLGHDRPIRARYDESVAQAVGRAVVTIRRARGLAPAPVPLPWPARSALVAAGA